MRVNILFEFKDISGGGNQFLFALKKYFISKGVYEENKEVADVILFNSHQEAKSVLKLKLQHREKIFVHRIDGPIRLYNKMSDKRDGIVNILNKNIADATIFQSKWSREKNYEMGIKKKKLEATILNAPDPKIFNTESKVEFSNNRKIRLIATSWSNNIKKGFDIYAWLDKNLDFSKYEMTFIGNSPVKFNNVKIFSSLPSKELATQLKKHDIFITASQKDPCSNSLIEALHCGLPVIALNDGGHPEIVSDAGEIFNKKEKIPYLLKKITKNYFHYTKNIKLPDIQVIGERYLSFLHKVLDDLNETGRTRRLSIFEYFSISLSLFKNKLIK